MHRPLNTCCWGPTSAHWSGWAVDQLFHFEKEDHQPFLSQLLLFAFSIVHILGEIIEWSRQEWKPHFHLSGSRPCSENKLFHGAGEDQWNVPSGMFHCCLKWWILVDFKMNCGHTKRQFTVLFVEITPHCIPQTYLMTNAVFMPEVPPPHCFYLLLIRRCEVITPASV